MFVLCTRLCLHLFLLSCCVCDEHLHLLGKRNIKHIQHSTSGVFNRGSATPRGSVEVLQVVCRGVCLCVCVCAWLYVPVLECVCVCPRVACMCVSTYVCYVHVC